MAAVDPNGLIKYEWRLRRAAPWWWSGELQPPLCLLKLSQTRSTASPCPSSLWALFCFHVNMYFFKQIILFSVLDQEFCLKFYSRLFDQNPQCWIQIYPLTNSSQERQLDMHKARNKNPSSDSYKEEKVSKASKDYESWNAKKKDFWTTAGIKILPQWQKHQKAFLTLIFFFTLFWTPLTISLAFFNAAECIPAQSIKQRRSARSCF